MANYRGRVVGILAEFEHPAALIGAAKQVVKAGYRKFDCHTPFPIHGLDDAMGMGPSRLGWVIAGCAFAGTTCAYLLQWWVSAVAYPHVISGKEFNSVQAWVPVMFEVSILFAAFAAVFGMLAFCFLPRFNHPMFNSEAFARATEDKFFVSITSNDPQFDERRTEDFLKGLGAKYVELVFE